MVSLQYANENESVEWTWRRTLANRCHICNVSLQCVFSDDAQDAIFSHNSFNKYDKNIFLGYVPCAPDLKFSDMLRKLNYGPKVDQGNMAYRCFVLYQSIG